MSSGTVTSPIASTIFIHPLCIITPFSIIIAAVALYIHLYPVIKTHRLNAKIATDLCNKDRSSLSIGDIEFILKWAPRRISHAWVLEDMRQSRRRRRVATAEIKSLVGKLSKIESIRNLSNTKIRRVEDHLRELPQCDILTGASDPSRDDVDPPPYYSPIHDLQWQE
ncbi:hypothetical protein FRB93_009194 [Tulasnella sp. JGI-2019a]|nr:hypothetical protein FRB93_009194 [Tulasnella sp. JGI-2019a]